MHTQTILPAAGVVVAAAAAVIAFQQWRTNHNQFRFALFQRRIGVYDAVMELMAIIVGKGEVTWEQLRGYAVKTREASFIFDDQVQAYCDEVYKRGVKLMVAHHVVETAPGAPSYKQMVESEGKLLIWFNEQLDIAKSHFKPFLRIREGVIVRLWQRSKSLKILSNS
jgi:hypothetical protein